MKPTFADSLRELRTARGISQRELASMLFVDRSTVARWETGTRMPDATLIPRIAQCLGVDSSTLLDAVHADEAYNVIVVDDERPVLTGTISVLEKMLPYAVITGFAKPSDARSFARANPVTLALLDVEMGRTNGLDLCRELLTINPRTNVIFLTAYREYSLDAWTTGASGFLLKPVTADALRAQIAHLRYPVPGLLAAERSENVGATS